VLFPLPAPEACHHLGRFNVCAVFIVTALGESGSDHLYHARGFHCLVAMMMVRVIDPAALTQIGSNILFVL
jgi:hypothetical protein